jgi:hypothetical protein
MRDVVIFESDGAIAGRDSPRDGIEKRRLSGAIWSDNGTPLAAADGQRYTIHRTQRTKGDGNIRKRESGACHRRLPERSAGTPRVSSAIAGFIRV